MPNDTKQNNNQINSTNDLPVSNVVSTQDTTPVLAVEDVVPPMPQVGLPKVDEVKQEGSTVETKNENASSGSAAPSDDIQTPPVIMGTTPKKKFGNGKVIATILGLFLLVGGLGAGTMLVQQNQDIRERAGACGGGCGPDGMCAGDLNGDGDGECVPRGTTDEQIDTALQPGSGGLNTIGVFEPAGDANIYDNPNIPNAGQENLGAGQTWTDWQNEQNSSGECTYESITSNVGVQNCSVAPVINQSNCAGCTTGCYAGTCAIYYPSGTSGCATAGNGLCMVPGSEYRIGTSTGGSTGGGGGGGDNPTPPPGDSITAVCQNVKAYDTSWVELTSTQLSQLNVSDSVNFCVTGVATGGSFDKAQFTINGVAQAETTTVRPGSTDFCQTYVIPASVTAFNVTALINHVSLGWK